MMDQVLRLVACAIIGYLMGGISFAVLVSKWRGKTDIRQHGSGNAGATNMLRMLGWGPALLSLVGDAGKGALAVLFSYLIAGYNGMLIGGLFAVVGHIWPLFFGFRGGKGISTVFGVALCLNPVAALLSLGVFILIIVITRYVSLGAITGVSVFPIFCTLLTLLSGGSINLVFLLQSILLAAICVYAHRENIHRLCAGTERKFGQSA